MLDPVRAKLKIVGVTAGAFAGGVLLASGLDWTAGGHASLLQTTSQPSRADVRPVQELSQAFIAIAEAVTPAVVAIETERAPEQRAGPTREKQNPRGGVPEWFPFPMPDPNTPQESSGSGFLISDQGYIMTNNHVVADADKINVVLGDNRVLQARLVGRDPLTDVAVIKVDGGRLPAVRIGKSDDTKIGEWVLAIGNPLELGTTVTAGIVSAKGRGLNNLLGTNAGGSRWAIEDFIQTDAPINPGNSGGPLINLRGEVVGINSAIASPTGFYSGYGFAVPIDLAHRVAEDLIRYGRVRRPALGVSVTPVTPEDAEVFKLERIEGVVAQDFQPQSAAREAGLQQGDVIVAVNGQRVERVGQFQRLIASRQPGETVALDVVRFGDRRRVQARLAEAPENAAPPVARRETPAPTTPKLGIGVAPATGQQAGGRGNPGVVINEVEPSGAAARYGIREGTRILAVDGQEVRDVAGFRRLVERKRPGQVVSLRVVTAAPNSEGGIINVRLPD
ncbi:MAG TPA: Do family serine endopeptidase [Longimicrobium sp.]|nr:Do family serine endopeptidase [Longimicrobium sp.]